jgi:hypothetical protein
MPLQLRPTAHGLRLIRTRPALPGPTAPPPPPPPPSETLLATETGALLVDEQNEHLVVEPA